MIFAKDLLAILDGLTRKSVNCVNQILVFVKKILNAPNLGINPNPRVRRVARAVS
jgi:hypothetical protein